MKQKDTSRNKTNNIFAKLLIYMKPWWGILIFIILLSLAGSAFGVLAPVYMKNIVNEIQTGISEGMNKEAILHYSLITVAILAASFFCNLLQAFLNPLLSQKTAEKMRFQINEKSNKIPLNYFDTSPEGETLSTMTNDIDQVSTSFASVLPSLITALATFVGCLVLMFITNAVLAVTTIVSSLVGIIISFVIISKASPCFKMNQDRLAQINTVINEDIKGHLVIKSFGAESEVLSEFHKLNRDLYDSTWKSQFAASVMMPVSGFAGNLGYIAVCIVGAFLVLNGKTQIGTIIAFIQYAQLFSSPIATIMQSLGAIQPALAAGERIFNMLDYDEMEDNGSAEILAENIKGDVEFSHIKFGYVPENIIIHDFSCKVKAGRKIAIVGPTGAGKSTIINLLTRFYELNSGDIKIDGVSIYDMSRETLHNLMSMVLQDTWTFEGTIRDNIVYSKQNVDEDELLKVVEDSGLSDFVRTSPQGLDTVLSEECDVSAGQKQLITIARAMLKNAPILILDEATSSVDTRTEKIISTALDKLMSGRTSFVIAHRLSTIRNADLILVLKDGDVIETGNHYELMKKEGFYANLYMSQFDTK